MYTRKYKEYLNDFQKTKSEVSDEDLPLAWFLKEDTYLKINAKGSHIIDFFRGKCVFITGGSGFLGRILIEKLLRACDDIDTIYMLIRDKKGKDGDVRLQEMFDSDVVFSKVKELRPNCLSKITVMKGDVSLPGLGLSTEDTKILQDRVNVIIHGAATVRFDAKIREAVNINIKGTLAVIALAEQCKNLASFVHISTAFSNCPREEIDELFYDPPFSVEEIIDIVDRNTDDTLKLMQPKLVGEFPNTYTLTKCVAESVIRKHSEVLPISVFRPSIVITTYREPLKSWINNIYGPIGMAMGSGIGLVHTFNADLSKISDMVPCDFVANAILAVAYKTAQKNAPKIYNYVSSAENPLSWFDFERQIALNGQKTPSIQCLYVYSCYYTKYRLLNWFLSIFLHLIPGALIDMFFVLKGDKPKLLKAYKKVHKFNSLLRFFSTQEWTFKNENTQSLWKSLSEEDREAFTFSVKELDWHIYCITALLGCRCYIIKDELSTIAAGRKIYKKLRRVHYVIKYTFLFVCLWMLYMILTKYFSWKIVENK